MPYIATDPQEVFNTAVKGLASQGWERSIDEDDRFCAYRGGGGRRCAAGWLIPDELYRAEFEGNSIGAGAIVDSIFGQELTPLLIALQSAHDSGNNPDLMCGNLRRVALRFNLTLPPELVEP